MGFDSAGLTGHKSWLHESDIKEFSRIGKLVSTAESEILADTTVVTLLCNSCCKSNSFSSEEAHALDVHQKQNMASVYFWILVVLRRATLSVDSISDYNEFCCLLPCSHATCINILSVPWLSLGNWAHQLFGSKYLPWFKTFFIIS